MGSKRVNLAMGDFVEAFRNGIQKVSCSGGCGISLHNYCVNARLELTEELKKGNGSIKLVPGLKLLAPVIDKSVIPVKCQASDQKMPVLSIGQTEKVKMKADFSKRTELEQKAREEGLRRPYPTWVHD